MISKGFNFPKLNCIVVIDADFSGRGYDQYTESRYHQLSGRAGRFSSRSIIIYQTLTPHDIIPMNNKKSLRGTSKNELILEKIDFLHLSD